MSTLVCHFVSSPREREKRDSRRDEREEQGIKFNRNESGEFMSPALFLFEVLKMVKLTRGPLVLYQLPKY